MTKQMYSTYYHPITRDDIDADFVEMIQRGGYSIVTMYGIHIVTDPNGDIWTRRQIDYPNLTPI